MTASERPRPANDGEFLPGNGETGLVSVVIPTYNRASLITTAVDSVLGSTYTNVEVLVIDDGSVDETPDVMARYTDRRVRYLRTENGGMSAARNHGLDHARGEFIAFLDSDDAWLPWKVAAQVELLARHPDVGLVWTDMSAFEKPGEIISARYLRTYYEAYAQIQIENVLARSGTLASLTDDAPAEWKDAPYYTGDVFREMFLGSLVHPSTALIRRDRVRRAGRFDFSLTGPGAEDYHFYYRIAELGPVALLDAPTVLYHIGDPTALSRAGLAQARGNLNVLSYWKEHERPHLPPGIERKRITGAHAWVGTEELFDGDIRAARAHLWKSLRLNPTPKIAVRFLMSLLPRAAFEGARKVRRYVKRTSAHVFLLAIVVEAGALYGLIRLVISVTQGGRHILVLR